MLRALRFVLLSWFIAFEAWAGEGGVDRVAVLVESTDSKIDVAAIRSEIGAELGVTIVDAPGPGVGGTLRVRVGDKSITLAYTSSSGRELTRSVARPKSARQEREIIVLLAGNLARDEALELAERLRPKPEPSSAPETAKAAPESGPSEGTRPSPSAEAPETSPLAKIRKPSPPAKAATKPPSQEPELPPAMVNLSLLHPIAIVEHSERRRVHVELGLAYSRVGTLSGFGLSLGVLRTDHAAQGFGLSGIWTRQVGPSDGAFVSGLVSTAWGKLRGVEVAPVVAFRDGDVNGAQASAIFSRADSVEGLQASAVLNSADSVDGVEATAVANYAPGRIRGVQVAIVNVGGDVDGSQVGLVNFAGRVRGVQIGLFNSADRVDGLSLAPISILAQNRTRLVAWADSELPMNLGVKYETGRLYSLFTLGLDPFSETGRGGAGLGVGVHVFRPLPALSLDLDVLYRYILPEDGEVADDRHSTAARGIVSWQISKPIALFATGGVENRVDRDNRAYPYGGVGLELF